MQEKIKQGRDFLKAELWGSADAIVPDQQLGKPCPPVEKPFDPQTKRIQLAVPNDFKLGKTAVAEVISQRRSRRKFSTAPMTLDEVAYLCWAAQGVQKVFGKGEALFRTVPSAGARHALELYLAVGHVDGLAAGLYRYLGVEHELLLVRPDSKIMSSVAAACCGQTWMSRAAVNFIFTAIPYRMEWRYSTAAGKLVALDAGHACQNLCIAAESIDAGVCPVAAYLQQPLDEMLGIDGREEFAVYLASAGKK
ncbi:MAG: SagB/ThcOx family dehydrogenase [Anaerohalosphaeraceae bacterium]